MTANDPKVSIVLPTFNGARYLKRSIESCLSQTHQNIELILVDDCSSDETQEIVRSFSDKRIKIYRNKRNLGLPASLNVGFGKVSGEFLTWTSDDNYYDQNAIAKMLAFLKEQNCCFVFCDFYRFRDDEPSKLNLVKLPDVLDLAKNNDVGACVLYSRKVKEFVGDFDVKAELAEDYDYWLRVSKKFRMCHLSEPLYYYREHAASLSLSRFYEVRAAEILVKSKNGAAYDKTLNNFVSLCLENYSKNFVAQRFGRLFCSMQVRKRIRDFESGKASFSEARIALKNIAERRLPLLSSSPSSFQVV